ncbi:WD40 repeat-like protein [Rhizoctonia solani]|uniref:WD40 repeat-like protein n=1 Tax=Rhizoctonia solani TaxID=456999 RepID=A0A8H7HBX5_9AGAM|nr:WD40 repeat-like protein [Rhizoctonia solani]
MRVSFAVGRGHVTTPLASDSGSVSPTLVASLPGSPPDESVSVQFSLLSETEGYTYPYTDSYQYPLPVDLPLPLPLSLSLPPETAGTLSGAATATIEAGRKRRRIDTDYLIDDGQPDPDPHSDSDSHPRPLKLPRQSLDISVPDHDRRPMRYTTHTDDPNGTQSNNGFATNGKSSSSSSSPSSLALVQPPWSTLYKDSVHDREQVVRTILQALRDVGYTEAAATLERESGYQLESDDVVQLRHAVTHGLWDEAPAFLRRLGVAGEHERTARFLISQQKYLEQLEALQPTAALQTLRGELVMYCSDPERGADVMERAHWDGALGTSRPKLLAELQRLISPSIMLPPRRLDTLLSHARSFQRSSCTHHAGSQADKTFSLYVNHSCSRTQFPTLATHILAEHLDEVWRLEWSHDGRFLASASQDKTAIIWKIADLQPDADPTTRECLAERVLSGHEYAVNALAWSPDDKILLTSAEHVIKMWDVSSGASLRDLQNDSHSDMITCLVWLPDGSGFVSGSMDCHIVVWVGNFLYLALILQKRDILQIGVLPIQGHSSTGEKLYELGAIDEKPLPIRVTDLTITPDGSRLVAVGTLVVPPPTNNNFDPSRQTRSMKVFSLSSKTELFSVGLSNEVTSVKATADSRYVLISHAPDEVQLWDLDAQRMCQKYMGHYQGKHVIRSCLGGPDEGFVLSGSEDQTLYVWKRDTGALIEVLSGHGNGCVNDVAWNPRDPALFASCSDDHTIRLWSPPPPNLVGSDLQDRHSLLPPRAAI